MRGVAGDHRTAARLRHVADEYAGPPRLGRRARGEIFEETHEIGMPPKAIARNAHDLPGLAVHRQGLGAGKAPPRIKPDGARGKIGGFGRASEQFIGRRRRVVGPRQRRQGLGVDGADFLGGAAGYGRERQNKSAEKQLASEKTSVGRNIFINLYINYNFTGKSHAAILPKVGDYPSPRGLSCVFFFVSWRLLPR